MAKEDVEKDFNERNSISSDGLSYEEDVHLRDYFQVILKHRWIVISPIIVIVAFVAIRMLSVQHTYTAVTTVLIEKKLPKILEFEDILPIDAMEDDYYQTQYQIIQSRTIAKRVIEKLALWEHAQFKKKKILSVARAEASVKRKPIEDLIDSFLGYLEVAPVNKSRLVKIKYTSNYPDLSTKVANTIAETYIRFTLESKFKATEKARSWLSGQLIEFQDKMEESERVLYEFAKRKEIFSLEKDENLVFKRLEGLSVDYSSAKSDRISKEAVFKKVIQYAAQSFSPVLENVLIRELKIDLSEINAEYTNLSNLYKPDYPKMVRLKAKIKTLEKGIKEELENIINAVKVDYMISLEKESLLKDALGEQKKLSLKMKENSIQYNIFKRKVDTNKELYDGLLQRLKETGVLENLESSNIEVIDQAVIPKLPSNATRKINIFISLAVGLFTGVGFAFFVDYLDNSVSDPKEVKRSLNLSTLGFIPSLRSTLAKSKKDKDKAPQPILDDLYLLSQKYPRSLISESYRTFRTSLLFSSLEHIPKTILITSNNSREGKTTVACNLAIALAHGGANTLIIDADLRKPFCHEVFSVPNNAGLTDCLTGNAVLRDIIKPTEIKRLCVIPSGHISPDTPELLDSDKFREIVEKMRTLVDFIIFDSASVTAFADTLNLAKNADGTVIVVHGGKTSKDDLRESVSLLKGMRVPVLGVVFNNVNFRSGDYKHGYQYQDYFYNKRRA